MFKRAFCLIFATAAATVLANEVVTNREFTNVKNGVPAGWEYKRDAVHTANYSVVPADSTGSAALCIESKDASKSGLAMFVRRDTTFPAGTLVTISGEYRTENIVSSKGGSTYASIMCRHNRMNHKAPSVWLNAPVKPSEQWKKFSASRRLPIGVETTSLYVSVRQAKGKVFFRNLSVKYTKPSAVPDPKAEYIWREAEDIYKFSAPSNWGFETPNYFSGKGGVVFDKRTLDWNFEIDHITDERSLTSIDRTWHIWARVYGYIESPRFFVYHNERFLQFVDTPPNEKADKKGNYAGPGKYTWVHCGSFTTKGGTHKLSFNAKGRALFDAILLTTDANYAPELFEARKMPQTKARDIFLKTMIRAEYLYEGVTDTLPLPITFRCAGERKNFKGNEKPAVLHLTLPEFIQVAGVSSHRAGKDWNEPAYWGDKYMTFSKIRTRTSGGIRVCDYEVPLYSLNGNQYLVFIKADKSGFKAGKTSVCQYFLTNGSEKQPVEQIVLHHIPIKTAKPFKKIYVGPNYIPFNMIYRGMPDAFANLNACGLNYLGAWYEPWKDKNFDAFRNAAYAQNFMISIVVPLFQNIRDEDIAIGLDGKKVMDESGSQTRIVNLAIDDTTPTVQKSMELTKLAASTGVSVIYDDEMTNVLGDKIDYSPATKELFRQYLKENYPTIPYTEPENIVKNKKADPESYKRWVDFKCMRYCGLYAHYRKAFDEGVKLAAGKYPVSMKPRLITCVQGSKKSFDNVRELMEQGYLDYKLLSKYCDNILIMSYSYNGVPGSAAPADSLTMHNAHVGKNITGPVLLSGGYGTETSPEKKVMLKYQVLDCLMEKPQIIEFYAGATLFNAPTMAPVTEAIRIAQPYEDFFVDGEKFSNISCDRPYVRTKALKLGKKLLIYVSNYNDEAQKTATVTLPSQPKSVKELNRDKETVFRGNKFSFDFISDRGKMFIVEF